MSAPSRSVRFAEAALADVIAHARARAPEECCGVLLGGADVITQAVPATNLSPTPSTRFDLDPADHLGARRVARGLGLDVVGFYHSHPASRAWPSPTDIAEWAYPDALCVIVGLAEESPEVRAFSVGEGGVQPVELERADASAPGAGAPVGG